MTDVEKIALWAGLISSIVSIVLSIVATTFAVLVNNRSEKVSDATIKSLQKIELTIEQLSDDTSGLIKAAWDAMLGSLSGGLVRDSRVSPAAAHELASGVAAEVRSEIGLDSGDQSAKVNDRDLADLSKKINAALSKMEQVVAGQLRTQGKQGRPSAVIKKSKVLEELSPPAQQFVASLKSHLTREEYKLLTKGPLSGAVQELREAGLLVPLTGIEDGKEAPVYYFPPNQSRLLRLALLMLPRPPVGVRDLVQSELDRVGYDPKRFDP